MHVDEMDDQFIPTEDLVIGIPTWVAMLAVRQCVRAGHAMDSPGVCRACLLEARRQAAWLDGAGPDRGADWDARR